MLLGALFVPNSSGYFENRWSIFRCFSFTTRSKNEETGGGFRKKGKEINVRLSRRLDSSLRENSFYIKGEQRLYSRLPLM